MTQNAWSDARVRALRGSMSGILILLATAGGHQSAALETVDPAGPGWSYAGETGPPHWGNLAPAYERCGDGRSQSPIDITHTQPVAYTPLSFHYRSHLLEILNTGQALRILCPPGSALIVRGDAYDLEEIDFHVPGEHRFNGVQPPAEIQLMHRDGRGGLVGVAVPVRAGQRENLILGRILDYLPMHRGERVRHRQVGINPLFLLPANRGYYRYTGSQVTPPCTEPVLWFVLREPVEAGPEQIQRIYQAVGPNARPVQPDNDRPVFSLLR